MTGGRIGLAMLMALTCGCASNRSHRAALREARPASILVLPPTNGSGEALAAGAWLSTVTRPLTERGYYVFPVHVVSALVSPTVETSTATQVAFGTRVGADAVLQTHIKEWGTIFHAIGTEVRVSLAFRLVDPRTGRVLWQDEISRVSNATGGRQGNALVTQVLMGMGDVIGTLADPSRLLAREVNRSAFFDGESGLLPGPYADPGDGSDSAR